jgi:hypothetical protein
MSLNQQNRTRIVNVLCDLRADWHHAGTEAALLELDRMLPHDPLAVLARAVRCAQTAGALPNGMLRDQPEPVAVTPKPTPSATDPECPECGSQLRDSNGECAGCILNARLEREEGRTPGYLRVGTSGPPADFRERVAASIEANRRPVQHEGAGNE